MAFPLGGNKLKLSGPTDICLEKPWNLSGRVDRDDVFCILRPI